MPPYLCKHPVGLQDYPMRLLKKWLKMAKILKISKDRQLNLIQHPQITIMWMFLSFSL